MSRLRIRRLLVAGGAGFLGSAFVRDRLSADPEILITVLDAIRRPGADRDLKELDHDGRVQLVRGDVCDGSLVTELAAGSDAIANFASEEFTRDDLDAPSLVRTDIAGTATLLEAAARFRLQRFLLVSNSEVYGPHRGAPSREEDHAQPVTEAAAVRLGAEILARAFGARRGLSVVIARGPVGYGPWQPLQQPLARMISSALQGLPLRSEIDGSSTRDYLFVDDYVSAIARILWKGEPGGIYNIGSGPAAAAADVMDTVLRLSGKPPSLKQFTKSAEKGSYAVDARRLRPLGWEPRYGLTEGLRTTIDWYRKTESWWRPALVA